MPSRCGTSIAGCPHVRAAEALERRVLLSTTVTTLATFDGTNGTVPQGSVYLDAAGDLFGIVAGVPKPAEGTTPATTDNGLWELAKGATAVRILGLFDAVAQPYPVDGLVADGGGNLYGLFRDAEPDGTTGAKGGGVWEYDAATGQVTTRATFAGTDGEYPAGAPAVNAAGDLFGATGGGTTGGGYAWELPAGSSQINPLASFDEATGVFPDSPVYLDASGALYGATGNGGAAHLGTIWKLVGNTITVLTTFAGTGIEGVQNLSSDGTGQLFGDGPGGANGAGAAFELDTTAAQPVPKLLVSFNRTNDLAELTISGTAIYGTLEDGGTAGAGEVAEINLLTGIDQAVAFSPADALGQPVGAVVVDPGGNLFGTASVSGVEAPVTSGYNGGVAYGGVYEVTAPTVAAAADPPRLVFTTTPVSAQATYSLGPDGHTKVASAALGTFQVSVEDAGGQVVDADDGSDVTLTAIAGDFGGPDGGVLTVSPEPVVNGVATFTDAVITYPGDVATANDDGDCVVQANDDIDPPGISAAFTVDAPLPTSILVTPAAAQSAVTGAATSLTLGAFAATDAPGPYTISVSWGDGTADTAVAAAMAGPIADQSHTYAAVGSDTVSVTVTDATGDTSIAATLPVMVTAPPPPPPSPPLPLPPPPASPLAVAVLTRPATRAIGGSKATVAVRLTDISGVTFDGAVAIDIVVSPNGSADAGTYAGGVPDRAVHLDAGRSIVVRVPFTYPGLLPTGTYRIIGVADVSGSASTTGEADGAIALTAPFVDLSVGLPTSVAVRPGRRATVAVRLSNAGSLPAAGSVTLMLYSSTSGTVDASAGLLSAVTNRTVKVRVGRSTTVLLPFYAPPGQAPGKYELVAMLIPSPSLVDTDAADNTAVATTRSGS